MGLSLNVSVIKVTIRKINVNKIHAYIVLNIYKLQETLSKLSPLTIKDRLLYPVPVYSGWFLLNKKGEIALLLKAVKETRHWSLTQ